jgi:membrane protease YdiL (CAAX protease family)
MTGHLRVSSPWSQLAIFLGLFGGAFLLSSILMFVIFLGQGVAIKELEHIDLSKPELVSTMKTLQGVSSIFLFLLPAILYAVISFTSKPFYFLGMKRAEKSGMYGLAILCILLAFPFVFWLGQINQHIPLPQWMTAMEKDSSKQLEALLKVNHPIDIWINILIIAALPAICEELCFRGALQRILIHCTKSPWIGIIITSILFSAMHLQFQGFLPRMFLGIVLGVLYWYSGSLWTSILAHFVNNAVQVIAVSFAPQYVNANPTMPAFAGLVSGIIVCILLWVYAKLSTISYSKVYESDRLNMSNQFLF